MQLSISEDDAAHLVDSAVSLFKEAEVCADAGAWRGATVLLGAAVEAGIAATAVGQESELRARAAWPSKRSPDRWALEDLIRLATDAGWLPSALPAMQTDLFAPLTGDAGDAVRFLQRVRNMVAHPAACLREEAHPDFDDPEHMRPTYDLLHGIADEIFQRLEEAITAVQSGRNSQQ
jgi:hypothetical protein